MPITTIGEFIRVKMKPEQRAVVQKVRELMRECAPNAKELISYGIPSWKGSKLLAVLNSSKTHVTFAFARGVEFVDKYGLLEGEGKVSRHVKIRSMDDLDEQALRDYIRQAVRLDNKGKK